MSTQRKFWNDTGRTSDDGGMSGTLFPTPNSRDWKGSPSQKWKNQYSLPRSLWLMSSVVASPASLFRWQEPDEGTVMIAGSGRLFARLCEFSGPDSCWQKMSQDSCQLMLDGSSEIFSGTWPRWGTMRNGECFRQQPLVRRISGKESSLLPTPRSRDFHPSHSSDYQGNYRMDLGSFVRQPLPTPYGLSSNQDQGDGEFGKAIKGGTGELLSPQFVEAVMGLPIGWTDLDVLATQSSRKSPNGSDGESC